MECITGRFSTSKTFQRTDELRSGKCQTGSRTSKRWHIGGGLQSSRRTRDIQGPVNIHVGGQGTNASIPCDPVPSLSQGLSRSCYWEAMSIGAFASDVDCEEDCFLADKRGGPYFGS